MQLLRDKTWKWGRGNTRGEGVKGARVEAEKSGGEKQGKPSTVLFIIKLPRKGISGV